MRGQDLGKNGAMYPDGVLHVEDKREECLNIRLYDLANLRGVSGVSG